MASSKRRPRPPAGGSFEEGLRILSACPLCETHYNPLEARILEGDEERHLVHIRCQKCSNAILALLTVSHTGVSSVGLVTDLTYDDVVKFKESSEVAVDDVIAVHVALLRDGARWLKCLQA